MTELPQPLTPPNCNLKDFQFIPVDVDRLLKSETWILGNGDERAAAITLWLVSWQEVPAASLPTDDRMLAHLSQSKSWKKVKAHALRGWIEASDGRLYHPVVAEKALEAWIEKLANSISGASGNAKRWGVEVDVGPLREQFVLAVNMLIAVAPASKALKKKVVVTIMAASRVGSPPDNAPPSPPDTGGESPPDSGGDRNRQGQGQGQGIVNPLPPALESRDDLIEAAGKLSIAMRSHGIKSNPGDLQLKALAAAGVTPAEVSSACETAKESKPGQAISAVYVMGILKRGLQEAAKVRGNAKPAARKDWE